IPDSRRTKMPAGIFRHKATSRHKPPPPDRPCLTGPACLPLASAFAEDHAVMLDAAGKALSRILSPPMRSILWRSIGLALVLIVVLAIGLQRLLSWLATSGEAWLGAL